MKSTSDGWTILIFSIVKITALTFPQTHRGENIKYEFIHYSVLMNLQKMVHSVAF